MVAYHPMSAFTFQWPAALALLLLVFPLLWLLAYARKRRRHLIDAIGSGISTHRRSRDVMRTVAFTLLLLAFARPGYAPQMISESRSGRDVVFALDVSQSMLAQDVPPSRLKVAKQAIRDALDTLGNERVGLVVYAGSATILCPLTADYEFVRYMLDQAQPRTVDFGGTTLQSAVEKAADQVFLEGRGDVQDLVILTDGGDHDSQMEKVVELIESTQTDVLVIGLGNPERAAPIPIENEDGTLTLLESQGQTVYTKLDDEALHNFAAMSPRAQYVAAGTTPFNLGLLYHEFASEQTSQTTEDAHGVVIYQEAAFFLILTALLLLIISERWGLGGFKWAAFIGLIALNAPSDLQAQDETFSAQFAQAIGLIESGAYEEAAQSLSDLYSAPSEQSTARLAVLQFNQGLCLAKLSQSAVEQSPMGALSYAQQAQQAFLAAKRYNPELQRAGIQLQVTADRIGELRAIIDAQGAEDAELAEQMQALLEGLQALLKSQQELRERFTEHRDGIKVEPDTDWPQAQQLLEAEASRLEGSMRAIDATLKASETAAPEIAKTMDEPLVLMAHALSEQATARNRLQRREDWPKVDAPWLTVESDLERIIELLSGDSEQQSDPGDDWEEYDDSEDYEYLDSDEESMSSSEAMAGDLAAGTEMQSLPVPNYSADDILTQEQGNLQFRQQKRSSANAAKVEKDY